MVGKNNLKHKLEESAKHVPRYGLRKLSLGVASVLLFTTLYLGTTAHADANTVSNENNEDTSQGAASSTPYQSQNSSTNGQSVDTTGDKNSVNSATNFGSDDENANNTTNVSPVGATDQRVDDNAQAGSDADQSHIMPTNQASSLDANTVNFMNTVNRYTDPTLFTASLAQANDNVAYQAGTNGVNDSFNRYVTRTINVTTPDGKKTSTSQTVHFVRRDQNGNAGVKQADGIVKYVNWTVDGTNQTVGHFVAYDLPKFAGYVPEEEVPSTVVDSIKNQVVSQVVMPYVVGADVNVVYRALDVNQPVYIIDDDTNQVIKDFSVTGHPGKQINLEITIPDGYQLVSGQEIPKSVTIDPNNTTAITLHVHEVVANVTHDSPKTNNDSVPGTIGIKFTSGLGQSDLNHTVVRTVIITKPDGTQQTASDSVTFTRDATFNAITGAITYTAWSENGKHVMNPIAVPEIKGYAPVFDEVSGSVTVTPNNQNISGNVTYQAVNESTVINFVDGDHVVGSFNIDGNTGVPFNLTTSVLRHELEKAVLDPYFVIDDGTTVHGAYSPDQVLNVKVSHRLYTITQDNLNPNSWMMPNGVRVPDSLTPENIQHDITRVITITAPESHKDQNSVITQEAKFVRSASIDMGDVYSGADPAQIVKYTDWKLVSGNDHFAAVDGPAIAGYTVKNHADAIVVDQNSAPENVDITYQANAQTGKISYVDTDNKEVGATTLTGTTDDTVYINPKAPSGYEIVPGQNIPLYENVTNSGIATVVVKVKHHLITIDPDQIPTATDKINGTDNKQPGDGLANRDIAYNDLHKNAVRTVTINDPHTGKKVDRQEVDYSRVATIDDVTGNVSFSDWAFVDDTLPTSFTAVEIPEVAGYTKHVTAGDCGAISLTQDQISNWTDPNIVVTYTANEQTGKILYVDNNGTEISHDDLTGKTDQVIDINPKAPAGWKITPGHDIPKTVKATAHGVPEVTIEVEHNIITVDPIDVPTPADKKSGTDHKQPGDGLANRDLIYNDLHKTITRSVTINDPKGAYSADQSLNYTRSALIDDVTGDVSFSDWTSDKPAFTAVAVSDVPGYTKHITVGDLSGYTPSQGQIDSWSDPHIVINYTANDQITHIIYNDKNGKLVESDIISGKTDQTVDVNSVVPTGWKLTDGERIPETIHFTAEPISDTVLTVEHILTNVDHTKPLGPGAETLTNVVIDGAHEQDLNQAIVRTINITDITGKKTTIVQTANIFRDATVDEVTGDVTYTSWSTDNTSWRDFKPDIVAGYTLNITDVPSVEVRDGQKDVTIDISYMANSQTGRISYVDSSGAEISHDDLTGKTGEIISIKPKAPAGWEVTAEQQIPEKVNVIADGIPEVKVKIEHKIITVNPSELKNPGDKASGEKVKTPGDGLANRDIAYNDLHKTITRSVTIKDPHTGNNVLTQTLDYTRIAYIDDVTGDVNFSDWTSDKSSFTAVVIPEVAGYTKHVTEGDLSGYTPSQEQINAWSDPHIVATYTANSQSSVINYLLNGLVIKSVPLTGVTDQTINLTYNIPEGYTQVSGTALPKTYTFKAADNAPVVVQLVKNQALVIHYVDLSGNDVVTPKTFPGVTGQVIQIPAADVPAGYQLVSGQNIPATFTLNDQDTNELAILVKPMIVFVDAGDPAVAGGEIPNSHGAKYLAGVDKDDLNKVITRTINIAQPDGKVKTVEQQVCFARNAVVNAASGDVSYDSWFPVGRSNFEAYSPAVIDGFVVDNADSQLVSANTQNSVVKLAYHQIPQTHVPPYINVKGETFDVVPEGYKVVPGQAASQGSQLIVKVVKPVTPVIEYVTRTVTVTMPNGKNRVITQKVRKGSFFNKVSLPKLRGYNVVVTGGSLERASATSDMNLTVAFAKA